MIYLIAVLILILSFVCAPMAIFYAKKMAITDVANERSSHSGVVHRGGGILFIVLFYIGTISAWLVGEFELTNFIIAILIGSVLIAIVGWLDDYRHLSARIRFIVQIVLVSISVCFLNRLWLNCPILVEKIILILAWVWFINLYNFMDGADGFATQEAIFISGILFLLFIPSLYLLIILASTLLGFLRVNFPKAKIFMGDIGSLFLGYVLGGVLIYSVSLDQITIVQALILTSLFSFDATYTLIKRLIKKQKFYQAHRQHWYQRLLITGFSHQKLFFAAILYNILVLLILWLFSKEYVVISIGLTIILWLLYIGFIKYRERTI